MKVKTRLSLYCSLIFGLVFVFISFLIYGLYYRNVEASIFANLNKTAHISALFYLEEDELSAKEFDKIRKQFEEIVSDSSYQIYDINNEVVFGIQSLDIVVNVLEDIRHSKQLSFYVGDFLCYGILYIDNQGDFVVVAIENKAVLDNQVGLLFWILAPLFLAGVIAIIFLSRWVANIAYRPFSEAIKEVNSISTTDLSVQIKSPQTKDELQDLIDTFNDLLAKISETVVVQKNFVRYVSHEFKTPLASMLGNLDLFLIKDRTPEEYSLLAEKLMQQIFQMEEILDTLIIVSDLRKDETDTAQTRMDELLWEIINKMKSIHPTSKILINIDITPEDETLMLVNVERTRLLIALFNMIENAVKYSQKGNVKILLFKADHHLCLSIADKGIGIPAEQLPHIGKPFYRGGNTDEIQGSGIGLSLALRILNKNNIRYKIESEMDAGTKITIFFS